MQEKYRRYSLIILILVVGVVLFKECTPFLGGILGAFTVYVLVRKQMIYLKEVKKIRPSLIGLLLLLETILLFMIPIGLTAWLITNKLQHINLDTSMIMDTIQHIADLIQQKTGYDVLSKSNLMQVASYLPQVGQYIMGSISGLAVNLIVLMFILYFMILGGRKMEAYVYDLLPFTEENKKTVMKEIEVIVSSNAIGIPVLAIFQGVIAFLGYIIFQAPQPLLLGFLTCIATVIPIVGTAMVWLPLAAYMALTGDWVNAIGLVIYALLVISNIDNLARFALQKKLADTHPLITIFGVVIGLSLFGFMGIIFGPLMIAIFILCVDIFKREYLTPSAPPKLEEETIPPVAPSDVE